VKSMHKSDDSEVTSQLFENQHAPHRNRNNPRRVTLMLAFWKDIKIRPSSQPGAARPWPSMTPKSSKKRKNKTEFQAEKVTEAVTPSWPSQLMCRDVPDSTSYTPKRTPPIALSHVYEDLDGIPWPTARPADSMPEYDQVFQGF
jgi:hypothetical protein